MITAPNFLILKQYIIEELTPYWQKKNGILDLPIPAMPWPEDEALPPLLKLVVLPSWASDVGVNGSILVPEQFTNNADEPASWATTDWFSTLFWYLNGIPERLFELHHGPIYSYSYRLKNWDPRLWEYAWVNRIALFLRRWAARENNQSEIETCGPLPAAKILLTHDLDAIKKTIAIRLKQTAFHGFNAIRLLLKGKYKAAARKVLHALRFLFTPGDFDCLDRMCDMEQSHDLRSLVHVYGGPGGWRRRPMLMLIDPAYDLAEPSIAKSIRTLKAKGWQIGLHPSSESWENSVMMEKEKKTVEAGLGCPVTACRQHWLRFSWENTWHAQQRAGLLSDTTLGFNDRPGFRNGAALSFHPWDFKASAPMQLQATPLVLMDSHLYDYAQLTETERASEVKRWFAEIRAVYGSASVLWHPHTLGKDYGWQAGFERLILEITGGAV